MKYNLISTNPFESLYNSGRRKFLSMIPIPIRYLKLRSFRYSPSSMLTDSHRAFASNKNHPKPVKSAVEQNYNIKEKENTFTSDVHDTVIYKTKEHDKAMQQYDRLLEKMRTTDEQLRSLMQSWMQRCDWTELTRT